MLNSTSDILTLRDVQQTLKIGKNKALALVNSGELRAYHVGNSWRVLKEDLIVFIRRRGN